MSKLRVLDLFSGIGGFSLGLERTGGFKTVAFCEIEDYPRRVLAKHWPGVPIYDDVRTLTADTLRRDGIAVDVICGGFPCQDISSAGKGAGLAGERSGLWKEYARIVGELRPKFVLVENVAALLGRGLGDVLGDLAALGYDAEWHCIPASSVGAPHRRDRVWIMAYAAFVLGNGRELHSENSSSTLSKSRNCRSASDALADADCIRRGQMVKPILTRTAIKRAASLVDDSSIPRGRKWWSVEPDVGRVAYGVPSRVDRLKGLGNAVVPQIPQLIGQAILKAEGMTA